MTVCPSCGVENPERAKFCMECAAPMAPPGPLEEERKVVTTLICDLVEFTAMSERADPEDVDALLGRYHELGRRAIESHGGTVEKFIGDAVVGVFGVPAIHEDDPERAVRAALRILEAIEDAALLRPDGSLLQARAGVNTGEALVRLDVDPASGRGFLTGDAVNVAARLQAAAPPMGVAVGALTHELTERTIAYEELAPVSAKGKAEPVPAWLATGAVARRGIEGRQLTPLVGREVELAYLSAVFDKAVSQSTPQFALIVGEPGIGKSRLVRELSSLVDSRPEMITWRQGYCPPFGEDVTYGALADVVKAHAGVRDNDTPEVAEDKLEAVLPAGADREWFRQRLRALLGLKAPDASREENFAAWMRFFEEMASREPVVLVFEDLHWADDALLAFLEYLTPHLAAVPLLVVGTARPELFERRPGFASASPVTRVNLGPLSSPETARLAAALLGDSQERAKAVGEVVERCAGNPFFAEQSARLLADTSLRTTLPDSVQAVIAARLDGLPPQQKRLLSDAAVVGPVFWEGAVAAMGELEPDELEPVLSGLLERQLIRRIRESSMEGQREFAFVHALACDVAYSQLPRRARARKHLAVVTWMESVAPARLEDLADVLARHCLVALELADACGEDDLKAATSDQAIRFLTLAGERALRLDVEAACRHFERALQLAPTGSRERMRLLPRWARGLWLRNRFREAQAALKEAIPGLMAAGDLRAAAVAMTELGNVESDLGEPVADLMREAIDLLADDEPSPEKAYVHGLYALALLLLDEDPQVVIAAADHAMQTAAQIHLPTPVVALSVRGDARLNLGDIDGLTDWQKAIAAAREQGLGFERATIEFNSNSPMFVTGGARAGYDAEIAALEFARSHGLDAYVLTSRIGLMDSLRVMGRWDEALAQASELLPLAESIGDKWNVLCVRALQAEISAERGEAERAADFLEWLTEEGRKFEVGWTRALAMQAASAVNFRLGRPDAARDLLADCFAGRPAQSQLQIGPPALRIALACGDAPLALQIGEQLERVLPPNRLPFHAHVAASVQGLMAEARGEYEAAAGHFKAAAQGWHEFEMPDEEAYALLGKGRCLAALGRAPEASPTLEQAREIFERLGAKPALAETDQVLQKLAVTG